MVAVNGQGGGSPRAAAPPVGVSQAVGGGAGPRPLSPRSLGERVPGWLAWLAITESMYLGFIYAPPERTMGDAQRIFYFHVAAAWNGFLAFGVVFVASIAYLLGRGRGYSRLAYASAELGVFFTTITIVGGSVWARAVWNVWWTWDPRLTTTLLLWFVFLGYLLVRGGVAEDPARERPAAVLGIAGFFVVPLVYFSSQWWVGLHPTVITLSGGFQMAPRMAVALMFSFAAFTVFYLWLLGRRLRLEALREEVGALRARLR
jgi:heme exporter protein C